MARIESIVDADQVLKNLAAVPPAIELKVLPKAVRAGAAVQAKRAQQIALGAFHQRTGLLAKSIRPRLGKKVKGVITAIVAPAKSVKGEYKGKPVVPKFYQHLVELGHRMVVGKSGRSEKAVVLARRSTGKVYGILGSHKTDVAPHPFLAPAFEQTKGEATAAFEKKVEKELEKEVTAIGTKK